MTMNLHRLLSMLLPTLIFLVLCAERAAAIPAFSRKYRTSCNTCHVVYPKLNDFGQAFRRGGFQFPQDDDFFIKDQPVTLAADAWKDLWPNSLWPADLPNLPPISARVLIGMDQGEGAAVKTDLDAPTDVNFLAAGTFGRDISFFFHYGGGIRYYIQFSNLLEEQLSETLLPKYALNLKAGLIEPELLNFSNERRLSATSWLSHTSTYKRSDDQAGNSFHIGRQIGAELHGTVKGSFHYVLGVVSGNGDTNDNNNSKDIYGRASFKLGGMLFSGVEDEDEEAVMEESEQADPLFRNEAHVDNSITVGAFFWKGRFTSYDGAATQGYTFDFHRTGVDLRINYSDFNFDCGVMFGKDDNGLNTNFDITNTYYFAGLQWVTYPWLVNSCRFERINYSDPMSNDLSNQEISRWTITSTALIRPNLKVSAEFQLNNDLGYHGTEDDLFLLRLDFSF